MSDVVVIVVRPVIYVYY